MVDNFIMKTRILITVLSCILLLTGCLTGGGETGTYNNQGTTTSVGNPPSIPTASGNLTAILIEKVENDQTTIWVPEEILSAAATNILIETYQNGTRIHFMEAPVSGEDVTFDLNAIHDGDTLDFYLYFSETPTIYTGDASAEADTYAFIKGVTDTAYLTAYASVHKSLPSNLHDEEGFSVLHQMQVLAHSQTLPDLAEMAVKRVCREGELTLKLTKDLGTSSIDAFEIHYNNCVLLLDAEVADGSCRLKATLNGTLLVMLNYASVEDRLNPEMSPESVQFRTFDPLRVTLDGQTHKIQLKLNSSVREQDFEDLELSDYAGHIMVDGTENDPLFLQTTLKNTPKMQACPE